MSRKTSRNRPNIFPTKSLNCHLPPIPPFPPWEPRNSNTMKKQRRALKNRFTWLKTFQLPLCFSVVAHLAACGARAKRAQHKSNQAATRPAWPQQPSPTCTEPKWPDFMIPFDPLKDQDVVLGMSLMLHRALFGCSPAPGSPWMSMDYPWTSMDNPWTIHG